VKCCICVAPTVVGQLGVPALPEVSIPKSQPAMLTPAICTLPLDEAGAAEEVATTLEEEGAAAVLVALTVVVGAAAVEEAFAVVEVVAALTEEEAATEAAGVHWA